MPYPAVLFVPHTWQSDLANRLRKVAEHFGKKFGWMYKIVERVGPQIVKELTRSNPWAINCKRRSVL